MQQLQQFKVVILADSYETKFFPLSHHVPKVAIHPLSLLRRCSRCSRPR